MHDDDVLLSNSQNAKRHNHSAVSEWRWRNNPALNYPPPDAIINGREYRRVGTMREWEDGTCKLKAKKPTHLLRKAETANART